MKKILSILLLCSLPITTLANIPARQIGSAIIKLVKYTQYMGRHERYFQPKCIASHVLPLHENSENKHTIGLSLLSPSNTATVCITPKSLSEVFIATKFYQVDQYWSNPTITETTVTRSKPLDLDRDCVMEYVPGGASDSFQKIEVRLTKDLNPEKED
jgi:hypothetical protein